MSYLVPKYHFQVDWGGTRLGFTEVSGMKVSKDKMEYRDGLDPLFTKIKLAGMNTYDDITLKRGTYYGDNEFYDWWNAMTAANAPKRDVTISLLDDDHQPIIKWSLRQAWPMSVEATNLDANTSEVGIETMVVCHEGLTIEHL